MANAGCIDRLRDILSTTNNETTKLKSLLALYYLLESPLITVYNCMFIILPGFQLLCHVQFISNIPVLTVHAPCYYTSLSNTNLDNLFDKFVWSGSGQHFDISNNQYLIQYFCGI